MKCDCGCGREVPEDYYAQKFYREARTRWWTERDRGYSSFCWIWDGATNCYGYGYLHYKGIHHKAHRLTYTWYVGPITDGLQIDHLCRNRDCVRPDHLEEVTIEVNCQRGLQAKLNPEVVRFIRQSYDEGNWSMRSLANTFSVSYDTVHSVINRKTWRNIK